ncbi:MAG TPA: peptidoglycan-binding protein [Methyloceanibacter sp.]|nr:peptidoglycan-binding protein [Methyloceanibacter sp.]
MIPVDGTLMREIAPRFSGKVAERQAEIIKEAGQVLQATLEAYEINTRLRIAHFLGQTCHESAGFRTTEEFASGAAYEGRKDLGNVKKGDGRRYKGRGLLQLTGRANYAEYGKALGVDLENNPAMAAEPALSLKIACEYWKRRKLNADCDRDDIRATTRKINGGLNGLKDRSNYIRKAKEALARIEGIQLAGAASELRPVLRRGSTGEAVGDLQTMLSKLRFPLAIDQDFGAATELAVMRFQGDTKLTADGIVGKETWDAIEKAVGSASLSSRPSEFLVLDALR